MSDDILNTIEVLAGKVKAKEEEANKLKKLVNELCLEIGVDPRYTNIVESGSVGQLRSDEFYGQTLTAAIRNYLERRKSSGLGAASTPDIYRAIKDGGYKFETTNEENAKISVGNALRKTSSVFHRLPNGQYGLLSWYPSAKAKPEPGTPGRKRQTKRKDADAVNGDLVSNQEIRDVILAQSGEFQATDIEAAIKAKFPSKHLPSTKVASVIFILKRDKGLLREVSARSGNNGAVYAKI